MKNNHGFLPPEMSFTLQKNHHRFDLFQSSFREISTEQLESTLF